MGKNLPFEVTSIKGLYYRDCGRFSVGFVGPSVAGLHERGPPIVPLGSKSCNLLDEFPLKYTYEKVAIVESL